MKAEKIQNLPNAYRVTYRGQSRVILHCSNGADAICKFIEQSFDIEEVIL